jgi:putative transposase
VSRNYKFHSKEGLYFVSFATVYWFGVFVRNQYFECITDNLNYCIKNKVMELYAWCIMPSHVHLIFKSTEQKPEELIRYYKSFTSKQLIKLITENQQESRR